MVKNAEDCVVHHAAEKPWTPIWPSLFQHPISKAWYLDASIPMCQGKLEPKVHQRGSGLGVQGIRIPRKAVFIGGHTGGLYVVQCHGPDAAELANDLHDSKWIGRVILDRNRYAQDMTGG